MRLKILFFPIVFIICLAIFFAYIWPEIDNLRSASDSKQKNTQMLSDVEKRNADINAVADKISNNLTDKNIVESYLPNKNMEERIIGGINYLADDAGISLLNVSNKQPAEDMSVKPIPVETSDQSSLPEPVKAIQFNETSVSISGEYEQIKLFIDKLQKMALFNSIKSLTIKKETEKTVEQDNATDQASISKILTAEIVVKFGYLKVTDYSENQIAKLDSTLDQETIDVLKPYVAQKDVSIISETGETVGLTGKKNPFFLE